MIREMIQTIVNKIGEKGLSELLGVSDRMIRYYLSGKSKPKQDRIEEIQKIFSKVENLPNLKSKRGKKRKIEIENALKRIKEIERYECNAYSFLKHTIDPEMNWIDINQSCEDLEKEIGSTVYSFFSDFGIEQGLMLGSVVFQDRYRRVKDTLEDVRDYLDESVLFGLMFDIYINKDGTYGIEFYS